MERREEHTSVLLRTQRSPKRFLERLLTLYCVFSPFDENTCFLRPFLLLKPISSCVNERASEVADVK